MEYFLYCLLVFTPIIQNFFLGNFIGKIGNTPVPIIITFTLIFLIIKQKKITLYKENKVIKILLIYLMVINVIALFVYIVINNGSVMILGENIISKTIKGYLYFVFVFLYILVINTIIKDLNKSKMFKPIIFTTWILFGTLLIELIEPELFNKLFHNGTSYNRVRLFTSESSFTVTMSFIYPILSIYYYRYIKNSKINTCLMGIVFMIFFITSGSKSILINIPIVLAFLGILSMKNFVRKRKVNFYGIIASCTIIIIIITLIYSRLDYLTSSIKSDIESYTSIVTRFYTLVVAGIIGISYPFGIGNALYLNIFPKMLSEHIGIIALRGFNLSEIVSYIYATSDDNIGAKSGIAQYMMYWGIVGTVIMIYYLYKNVKNINDSKLKGKMLLLFLVIFIFIAIINFVTFDINYEIFLMILVVQRLIRLEKNIEK